MKVEAPLLTMNGIDKKFPGVHALNRVDFDVRPGEIHALLGANGAGKSTLMKVLSGAYASDEGSIWLNGKQLTLREPKDAIQNGIHCVYQEVDTALIPHADLTENVFLDRIAGGGIWIDWGKLHREAEQLLREVGLQLPVRSRSEELRISEKQLLLLARALANETRILILDEPTAPLGLEETNRLFALIRNIRDKGVGIVFISHRLSEVFELCDRITVMRDGKHVATMDTGETNAEEVVRLMLGQTFEDLRMRGDRRSKGEQLLEAKSLRSGTKVKNISFELHRGEVVAIVGLVGAGKTELSRTLFGADPRDGGELLVKGERVRFAEPADAIKAGLALVPEERRRHGVLIEESVASNLALPSLERLSRFGFLASGALMRMAEDVVGRLGVKPADPGRKVKWLSGGNQQKVAVGKWMVTGADILLFDEPTKGVDIGAKHDMLKLIEELAVQGKGVLYFTGEISEALAVADRILVMSYGRIVKELTAGEATAELILFYASTGEAEDR